MNFYKKLQSSIKKNKSLLCVGLDSDVTKLPASVRTQKYPQFSFNKKIIDGTHDLVCGFKPNPAFYEARGAVGIQELAMTCEYIAKKYPTIVNILDIKRGDIGNTNSGSVAYAFDYLHADAVTVQPYLGKEAMMPFLSQKEKGIFVLCRTSNPGAGEFQDLKVNGSALYKLVAKRVVSFWNDNRNCGLVVGATYPEELKIVRRIAKMLPILVPGVGAQGGLLERTVKAGVDATGQGLIVNVSRDVIFSSGGSDFALAARTKALYIKDQINSYR